MRAIRGLIATIAALCVLVLPAVAQADHFAPSTAEEINAPGTPLPAETARQSDNFGHPPGDEELPPGWQCPTADGTKYSTRTVWYRLYPHVAGIVAAGARSTSAMAPHVVVFVLDSTGAQQADSCAAEPNGDGNVIATPLEVAAGDQVLVAVGAVQGGPTQGSFAFAAAFQATGVGGSGGLDPTPTPTPGPNGGDAPTPNADPDGDGVANTADRCPALAGPGDLGGCPAPGRIAAEAKLTAGRYLRLRGRRYIKLGIKVQRLVVRNVPAGATVEVSCSRSACRRTSRVTRRGGQVTLTTVRNKRMRTGVRIEIRVTQANSIGRYFRYTILPNDYRKRERCLPVGSRSPRISC